jgi:hypothetical protein
MREKEKLEKKKREDAENRAWDAEHKVRRLEAQARAAKVYK